MTHLFWTEAVFAALLSGGALEYSESMTVKSEAACSLTSNASGNKSQLCFKPTPQWRPMEISDLRQKKKKSPLKSFGFALFFLSSEVSLCTEIVSFLTLIVQSVSQSMSDVSIKKNVF